VTVSPPREPAERRPAPASAGTWTTRTARATIAARTLRLEAWWTTPLLTGVVLLAFILYATFRAFENAYYYAAPYLSPFYSPCLATNCVPGTSDLGTVVGDWWKLSPALLILVFPLGFRLTCYYYRKAYYRAVWFSPPACAVAEPHGKYTGETRLPLIIQNVHRYFFYVAVVVSVVNTYDAVMAFHGKDGGFGFGLGNIVLVVNVVLLWAYTISCHSCRHITGGRLKHFSAHPVRYWMWTQVSKLNTRHMQLAWTTLATLAITDFYIMLVASGTISDPRFIG
jgi:hypothetical protein